jgi:hypothetical protein
MIRHQMSANRWNSELVVLNCSSPPGSSPPTDRDIAKRGMGPEGGERRLKQNGNRLIINRCPHHPSLAPCALGGSGGATKSWRP